MSEVNQEFAWGQRVRVKADATLEFASADHELAQAGRWDGAVKEIKLKDGKYGYWVTFPNAAKALDFSADELEAVPPEPDPQAEMIASLQAEVDRLTKALQPFEAVYAAWLDRDTIDVRFLTWLSRNVDNRLTRVNFETAYEALQPLEGSQNVE